MGAIEVYRCIKERNINLCKILVYCLETFLRVDCQSAIQNFKLYPLGHLVLLFLDRKRFTNTDGLRNWDPARSVYENGVFRFELWKNDVVFEIEGVNFSRRHVLSSFLLILLGLIILNVRCFSQGIEIGWRGCPFLERINRRNLILHFSIFNNVFLI